MTDSPPASTAADLKERHRAIRDQQSESLSIRIHRAISGCTAGLLGQLRQPGTGERRRECYDEKSPKHVTDISIT